MLLFFNLHLGYRQQEDCKDSLWVIPGKCNCLYSFADEKALIWPPAPAKEYPRATNPAIYISIVLLFKKKNLQILF